MLERITKYVRSDADQTISYDGTNKILSYSFMAHPETLLPMPTIDDPVERFVSVIKFYLSGWHIKPAYVFSRPKRCCCSFFPASRGDDILIFSPPMLAEASRSP